MHDPARFSSRPCMRLPCFTGASDYRSRRVETKTPETRHASTADRFAHFYGRPRPAL
ncbi:hypothetical protein BOSE125_180205 [Bosea sp. 125]|nr:hypothetical protein BOSE125_180205 [Bosea sp. 125]